VIRVLLVSLMIVLWAVPSPAQSQPKPRPKPQQIQPPQPQVHGLGSYHERQLLQIDQLIRLGYHSRAHALLEELAEMGAPAAEVRRRRIRIALAVGEHQQAVDLSREALITEPAAAELWRQLATGLLALGEDAEARQALDSYLRHVPEPKAGFATAVDVLRAGGDCRHAAALVDSARAVLGDPVFLSRPKALCLLRLDRPEEAAREARLDLLASPYNLALLRRDLLAEDAPPLVPAFGDELERLAAAPDARPEVALLAANVALIRGRRDEAWHLVEPRLAGGDAARSALHNGETLARELPLLIDGREQAATTDYLLTLLPWLGQHPQFDMRLRQKALDSLAEVCVFALDHDLLGAEPTQAVARFGEVLEVVRQGHPESVHLYAAQIELARFTRDRLRDPRAAAGRLEHLLMDLDLPLEGVALARLELGESYLAARDTSRARQVLTALGRDTEFRAPAGHAHFLLARLDLAEGHFATARDRFAAVALDNPVAPYANDALELGLVVAEELLNPTGGPDLLRRYSWAVWWELAAEPDSQRVALQRYLARATVQADLGEPQPLIERARLELAHLERAAGRTDEALDQLQRIVLDQPDGRHAARALALRGEILAEDRHDAVAARREYERLLTQYPDYLFATEIRLRLRELP
jgi:lipopolysaccharide biosynthesis regulator YciM